MRWEWNTLNQHLSYITIRGREKAGPSSIVHAPRAVVGGVSYPSGLLCPPVIRVESGTTDQSDPGDRTDNDSLVVPSKQAGDNPKLTDLGNDIPENWSSRWINRQVEYDLGSEDIMARYRVGAGQATGRRQAGI